ncbi:hypothetical protein MIND_00922200 [Mycena indigotica]|uniref:Uncharacterized protein n=1 Tax=Mycena indigotica TaxID=2126181 RepID=A0A8H6W2F4_9AGAR|nr:uncharacterized protein MIND_00922200 [Mycena indigotica]KAF7296904.1 hypothetical protein MIND_00922200 [Mycena indigotica]
MLDKLKAKASSLRLRIPSTSAASASSASLTLARPKSEARNSFSDTDYYRQTKEEIHSPVSWVTLYGPERDSASAYEPNRAINDNISRIHLERAHTFQDGFDDEDNDEDENDDISLRFHNPRPFQTKRNLLLDNAALPTHVNHSRTVVAYTSVDDDDDDDSDLRFRNPPAYKGQLVLAHDLQPRIEPPSAIVQVTTRNFSDEVDDGDLRFRDGLKRQLILEEPAELCPRKRRGSLWVDGLFVDMLRRLLVLQATLDKILRKAARRRAKGRPITDAPGHDHVAETDNAAPGLSRFGSGMLVGGSRSLRRRQRKGNRAKVFEGNLRSKSMPSFF